MSEITTTMKKIIELHRFFVKESKSYCSPFTVKTYLYYPIAYFKFISGCLNDIRCRKKYC